MVIRFYNRVYIDLPASPGSSASFLAVTAPTPFFGVSCPIIDPPSGDPPTVGCELGAGFRMLRYRYSFPGAPGLRPGIGAQPGPEVGFLSVSLPKTNPGGSNTLYLPWTSNEWEDFPFFLPGRATDQYYVPILGGGPLWADTRDMVPEFYETQATLLLEVDAECVPHGIVF